MLGGIFLVLFERFRFQSTSLLLSMMTFQTGTNNAMKTEQCAAGTVTTGTKEALWLSSVSLALGGPLVFCRQS